MLRHTRTVIIPTMLAILACCALPASASAMSVGVEANGELALNSLTAAQQAAALDKVKSQGGQLVRANFSWGEIAAACAGQSAAALANHANACYNWTALDNLVAQAQPRGIKVLLSTMWVPTWVNPVACTGKVTCADLGTGATFTNAVASYAAFIKAAGTRYKGKIPYWTIWNEPNSIDFFKPAPNPALYARLYASAAQALKSANPAALVAPGPTGPKSKYKPAPFIKVFQTEVVKYLPKSNARRFINAWAHNPYPPKPVAPSKRDIASRLPTIGMYNIGDIFKLLDAKPITKGLPVWATEFGYESLSSYNDIGVKPAVQAQYMGESFAWLAQKRRVSIAVWYGMTDNTNATDWQSGTFLPDGTPKPSFTMFQRMISVPLASVKKGAKIPVWGRSNMKPKSGKLVFSSSPKGPWYFVPGAKRASDGSINASFKTTKKGLVYFAVYDGVKTTATNNNGYGLYRAINVK